MVGCSKSFCFYDFLQPWFELNLTLTLVEVDHCKFDLILHKAPLIDYFHTKTWLDIKIIWGQNLKWKGEYFSRQMRFESITGDTQKWELSFSAVLSFATFNFVNRHFQAWHSWTYNLARQAINVIKFWYTSQTDVFESVSSAYFINCINIFFPFLTLFEFNAHFSLLQ